MKSYIRHVGIVVQDLKKELSFYKNILDFKVIKRDIETGAYIENLVNIPKVVIEWVKLKDKNEIIIELLKYNHYDFSPIYHSCCERGINHIAFTVDNLDTLYKKLLKHKITYNYKPQISPDGKVKVMYCYDYESNPIELVEEL
jgi:catechol 2,3-dioxygenase-like lactoylglutathione lyase family enzyme